MEICESGQAKGISITLGSAPLEFRFQDMNFGGTADTFLLTLVKVDASPKGHMVVHSMALRVRLR